MTSDQQGPTVSPPPGAGGPAAPKPRGGSRWPLVAVGAAALAVVLGLLATVLSLRALDQANDARDIARAAGAGRPVDPPPGTDAPSDASTAATPEPTGAAPPSGPTPDGSTEPSLSPQTAYKEKYVDERLTLRASCDSNLDIDLDKPEVRVSDGEELRFNARCGGNSSYLNLAAGTKGTQVDAATIGAADCNDRIEKGSIGQDFNVPARKGVVLCVKTSLSDAQERGDTWKMALVQVTDVNDDGTVVLTVRAWDIPL
ncbi:hypothetical protein RM555_23850 [Micromonospora sp. DSM 115977]|uniref:Serine/threonine protein kinase n=1 Tax=Micromonospora reichwaldensis TaxID=3075516 RepID=A0ABU2X1H8_9ACTN|nr:hypothetical protein [Micromonospora sp. DSM 115977]MDT0532034.1 hypothetical protein [Micromonospora sp. DSM 115977]